MKKNKQLSKVILSMEQVKEMEIRCSLNRADYEPLPLTVIDLIIGVLEDRFQLQQNQRFFIYKKEESSDILGAFFQDGRIGDIKLIYDTDKKVYYIVDGQQRISTLLYFFKEHEDIKKAILKRIKKYKHSRVLNFDLKMNALTIKYGKNQYFDETFKSLNGYSFVELPEQLQNLFSNLIVNLKVLKTNNKNLLSLCQTEYSRYNNQKVLNNEEKQKNKFAKNNAYNEIYDIAMSKEFLSNVALPDETRLNSVKMLSHTFAIVNGEYKNGSKDNIEEVFNKYENCDADISFFKESLTEVLEVGSMIFPQGHVFSEYKADCVNMKKITVSAFQAWTTVLIEQLITDRNDCGVYTKEQLVKNKDNILNIWKHIHLNTGNTDKPCEINDAISEDWKELITDHSNNNTKVKGRIYFIKKLLATAINN